MTTSRSLQTINELLMNLHGYTYFRPQQGPLKVRLSQAVLDAVEADPREELSGREFDLEVSIGNPEGEGEATLTIKGNRLGAAFSSQLALSVLNDEELDDLAHYLQPPQQPVAAADAVPAGKAILRNTVSDEDHHEKVAAAARLKVTPEWLKSVVPCTEYSYEEIDGKKYIREYYWSKELIERLFKIKCTKTTPEDLQYVAKECCEGDLEWAKELIGRLKSPNRPEPAPKEQSQKGQGRSLHPSHVRASLPKVPHGKYALKQGAAAAGQEKAPKASAESAGQAKAASDRGGVAGGEPGGAQGAGGRERSRRRHRKPMRNQKKDGAGKPDGAGDKQPPKS